MSNRRRANLTTSLSTAPASSPQASIIPRSRIPSRSYWLPLPPLRHPHAHRRNILRLDIRAHRAHAHGNKKRLMTLSAQEFLRRFLLHVLPRGFVRIRFYGFLAERRSTGPRKKFNICGNSPLRKQPPSNRGRLTLVWESHDLAQHAADSHLLHRLVSDRGPLPLPPRTGLLGSMREKAQCQAYLDHLGCQGSLSQLLFSPLHPAERILEPELGPSASTPECLPHAH